VLLLLHHVADQQQLPVALFWDLGGESGDVQGAK